MDAEKKTRGGDMRIALSDLAGELQVSRTVISARAKRFGWKAEYRPCQGGTYINGQTFEQRVFPPDQADQLREAIREAKLHRRGPWKYPAPRVISPLPAPATGIQGGALAERLRHIEEMLEKLVAAWT